MKYICRLIWVTTLFKIFQNKSLALTLLNQYLNVSSKFYCFIVFSLLTIQPDLVKEYGDVVKKCEEIGFKNI